MQTGETHTVREFCELAFAAVGTTVRWEGAGVAEKGVDAADASRTLIAVDAAYFRPTEVDLLLGDPTKAKAVLGWERKVSFPDLVAEMVKAECVQATACVCYFLTLIARLTTRYLNYCQASVSSLYFSRRTRTCSVVHVDSGHLSI